ncbi:flagellar biosynthesis anti-sigma factor FlgM [Zhongshania sp. BJYM1]|jgi:negative regulator of flagellin synthesis FlgM|uniref:flagellar biosynthesis anti-sigma factor FlgM n=1 Tax=Zhongshania aquatica TaxID=2965069 RepID=UPI0022B5C19E|nr:flagellar biosynthesis anti-sigma factor FlgM [Marortus sp. BJYM1]
MVERLNGSSLSQPRKVDSGRTDGNKPESVGASKTSTIGSNPSSITETPLMERTRVEVNSSDGIDRQKVEAIKTAIRNGEFNIDAKKVAEAMINMEATTGA